MHTLARVLRLVLKVKANNNKYALELTTTFLFLFLPNLHRNHGRRYADFRRGIDSNFSIKFYSSAKESFPPWYYNSKFPSHVSTFALVHVCVVSGRFSKSIQTELKSALS